MTQNYSLEVTNGGLNPLNPDSGGSTGSGTPLAIVTGILPGKSTLVKGRSGQLTCSVRSSEEPHIKWLKKVSQSAILKSTAEAGNILNVKNQHYQILPTAKDVKVSQNEFINVLELENVSEADNGTYICFVAKNGINSLTFKSATVFIISGK